jgi:glycosyltransferase involved in cell wall biosynthesis
MAVNQPAFFLSQQAKKEKAALYIAHNLAALPVVVEAAAKWGAACGFDAEDYHIGQLEEMAGKEYQLRKRIEDAYMPRCNYISAASPLIAATYAERLSLRDILVVNNVFPIGYLQPRPLPYEPGQPLKLCWFSQTVGSDRGLETLIAAMGRLPNREIVCTILGSCSESEKQRLLSLAATSQVREDQIHFMAPVPPDEIFAIAARHHIGLALETNRTLNRRIALTNKIFTYPLAGLATIATDTPGQRDFMEKYPGQGALYPDGDASALAFLLDTFAGDPGKLNSCREQAWNYARTVLNWEHEQVGLLERIALQLEKNKTEKAGKPDKAN